MTEPSAPHAGAGPRRLMAAVLWAGAAAVLGYHLALELATLPLAEPMGMAETVYASIARVWPHQYQFGNYVAGHDYYGPAYPALGHLFQLLVPDPYRAFRLANLACLLAACAVVANILRRGRCPPAPAAAVVAIVFALNAGSYSLQARPDFLVFLAIAGVLAVGQLGVQRPIGGVPLGLALGVLALVGYLTKPYAVFALGAVVSYLVLFGDRRRGLVAGALSGAILVGGVAAYARANPYYLLETFYAHLEKSTPDGSWLVHQALDFGTLAIGLLLLAALGIFSALRRPKEDLPRFPAGTGYWAWITGLSAAALLVGPGWHVGAYLTYFLHLSLLPLALLAVTVAYPPGQADSTLVSGTFLVANLAVLLALAPALPRPDPEWERLRADLLEQHGLVVVDSIMEPLVRERPGTQLADTGIERYALEEAHSVGGGRPAARRAAQEADALAADASAMMAAGQPAALYLDYMEVPNDQMPGGKLHILRNSLPWFSGPHLAGYRVAGTFRLHPYYAATNERRQYAGTWETLIIKLVRRPGP